MKTDEEAAEEYRLKILAEENSPEASKPAEHQAWAFLAGCKHARTAVKIDIRNPLETRPPLDEVFLGYYSFIDERSHQWGTLKFDASSDYDIGQLNYLINNEKLTHWAPLPIIEEEKS